MGGKHLKKLRAEKSKVRLKQKKTLAKGQNITNTSFKVKKIVTVEQLKKVGEDEPVSSWNIPLKDLLLRLNHYNFSSRLNALNGIKELFTSYPDILKGPSLRPTITRILELLSDPEHQIRLTAINLISFIFKDLPLSSIAPFNDILMVHLSCAMTHRETSIQLDSLKFIDIIITYAPNALLKNFQNIVQNFVRIIKHYYYGARTEISLAKGSKADLEKTRADILLRFYQILASVYLVSENEGKKEEGVSINSNLQRFSIRSLEDQYNFKKVPDMSALFKKSKNEENMVVMSRSEQFQAQVDVVMPLLFDTWAEFGPGKSSDGFGLECTLTDSAAQLLHVLLRIMLLLYEKMMMFQDQNLESWFISTYSANFKKFFVTNFPFTPPSFRKLEAGESSSLNLTPYLLQNLIISYLFYCFKIKTKNYDHETKIERYISSALMVKSPQGVEILSKVIEEIIDSTKNKKSDAVITTLVKSYHNTNSHDLRRRLFKILIKVSLEEKYGMYHTNHALLKWIKALPERLIKPRIPSYVVVTLLKIINRPIGAEVLKEIESRARDILDNLQHAKIEGVDQFEGQKLVANILYWCRKEVLEDAVKTSVLQKTSYPQELKSYVVNIFSCKIIEPSIS